MDWRWNLVKGIHEAACATGAKQLSSREKAVVECWSRSLDALTSRAQVNHSVYEHAVANDYPHRSICADRGITSWWMASVGVHVQGAPIIPVNANPWRKPSAFSQRCLRQMEFLTYVSLLDDAVPSVMMIVSCLSA